MKNRLLEMANLRPDSTGISKGTIYISSKEGNHGPRIKFFRGRPSNTTSSASIQISLNPTVLEDSLKLKEFEKKELFEFVILNYDLLLKFWNKGQEMFRDEVDELLNSIQKIKLPNIKHFNSRLI